MSILVRDEERRLLPRWRESVVAGGTTELTPLPSLPAAGSANVDNTAVHERLAEFRTNSTVGTAADAVAVGFVLGAGELVRQPAEFVLQHAADAGPSVLALARRVLGLEAVSPDPQSRATAVSRTNNHRGVIAALRGRLARTPRDPFAYLDLARRYAALGQESQAVDAMRRALALAPESRFVLRSSSRLFVHTRDVDRGHDILRRAPRTRQDPWLLAAEISAATVAQRTSRFIKTGLDLLSRKSLPPFHLSELAGALGTLEMIHGNRKAARKLFRQAMTDPTDNALAQAEWAAANLGLVDLPDAQAVPHAFEAEAVVAARLGDWDRALAATYSWLDDEPFSHKSAAWGSFVASTGVGDYGEAALIAREGLIANPNDQLLRNNLVFSLASNDEIAQAAREAERADISLMDRDTRISWIATYGLLLYQSGDVVTGRDMYRRAVTAADADRKLLMGTMALLHWAHIAVRRGDEEALPISAEALTRAEKFSSLPQVVAVRERLRAALSASGEGLLATDPAGNEPGSSRARAM